MAFMVSPLSRRSCELNGFVRRRLGTVAFIRETGASVASRARLLVACLVPIESLSAGTLFARSGLSFEEQAFRHQ